MPTTTDPTDPGLHAARPDGQNEAYLVLSEEERAKGFVRPLRREYKHAACGVVTRMSEPIAATYARDPAFYGATFCMGCRKHLPVAEFTWEPDGGAVGS